MSKYAQTYRDADEAHSGTASIILGAAVAVLLVAMCGGVLVFSWPANMEADYQGFGLLGAFVPVVAVIGAFCVGLATALTVRGGE